MRRIDWDGLVGEAIEAMRRAYCPYSRFPVGAAGLVDDGRVVSGCNVENAAYGATLCAECGMVSDLIRSGGGTLVAVAVVDGHGQILAPCGRCRQLIVEHAAPSCLVRMRIFRTCRFPRRTRCPLVPGAHAAGARRGRVAAAGRFRTPKPGWGRWRRERDARGRARSAPASSRLKRGRR